MNEGARIDHRAQAVDGVDVGHCVFSFEPDRET
jgi:hypothetical protein